MHIYKSKFSANTRLKNEAQVSYFVELPQSNFPNYTNALTPDYPNSLTFPRLWAFSPDLSRIPRHFPVSSRFPEIPDKW